MVVDACKLPAFGKLRQEDPEFKVILCYIVSWRSAWDTRDPVSENQKEKERKVYVGFISMYYISMIV